MNHLKIICIFELHNFKVSLKKKIGIAYLISVEKLCGEQACDEHSWYNKNITYL